MSITIEPRDAARIVSMFEKEAKERLKRAMRRGAERGRGILVRATPTDTGNARAAWKVIQTAGIGVSDQVLAKIFNDAPYIGILDLGARPHAVSEAGRLAIYAWVLRNLRDSLRDEARTARATAKASGRKMGKLGDRVNAGAMRATNAIIHKINTEGQAPTYFVRNNLEKLRTVMAREIKSELRALSKNPPRPSRGSR